MEQILQQILGEVQNLNKRFDNLEADVQIMKIDQQAMKTDLQVVKEKQLAMEVDLKDVKEKQLTMEVDLKAVKEKQLTMEKMLTSQGDHLHQLIKILGNTNGDLQEVKEDVQEVKKLQRKQEVVLESLSIKTVEQDAEIRSLRKAVYL